MPGIYNECVSEVSQIPGEAFGEVSALLLKNLEVKASAIMQA